MAMQKINSDLLSVEGLTTRIADIDGDFNVVDQLDFTLQQGETLALLGESGCGKSMTALSIMGLLPKPASFVSAGKIRLHGEDLLAYSERQLRSIRGNRIGMIFQDPMTSLNPVLKVGEQIREVLQIHLGLTGQQANDRVMELLDSVHIPDPLYQINNYPHQLSGGMKQRVMIALALAAEPEILIADEPTTSLDVTTQAQVLAVIKSLQIERGMSILLISHDLAVVSKMADRVAIMYAGELVEICDKQHFFEAPGHPYSRALFAALPAMNKRNHALNVIKGQVPHLNQTFSGCRFLGRCGQAIEACKTSRIKLIDNGCGLLRCINAEQQSAQPSFEKLPKALANGLSEMICVRNLKVHFPIKKGFFKRTKGYVYAVDGISIDIQKGKTLALVGESGCGKTTVGKSILRLITATEGEVTIRGEDLLKLPPSGLKPWRSKLQFVFQDPFSSMNPRMQIIDILAEGLVAQKVTRQDIRHRCVEMLQMVGLDESTLYRYPHEFSGGQRQRISIARALLVNPEFIVCDEPTSALDVSVQAQILNLLRELQIKLGLSYLFITHNISVVSYLADQIAVMYLGRIVERASAQKILHLAKHPYTRALLATVPDVAKTNREEIILEGELPSAINPPSGCYFHLRCPQVMQQCRETYPLSYHRDGHHVSCFLYQNEVKWES